MTKHSGFHIKILKHQTFSVFNGKHKYLRCLIIPASTLYVVNAAESIRLDRSQLHSVFFSSKQD